MVKGNNRTQNYLILQPVSNTLRVPTVVLTKSFHENPKDS